MKTIVIVLNSMRGGGAEKSMNLTGDELSRRGWRVLFISLDPSDYNSENVYSVIKKRRSLFQTAIALVRIQLVLNKYKPKVVIANCAFPELMISLSVFRCASIIVDHAPLPWGERQILGRIVRRILILRKSVWVSVSNHFPTWGLDRTVERVIPNPVDPLCKQMGNRQSEHQIARLVYLGRLSKEKNPKFMLEVSQDTHLPVLFIGDGKLADEIKKTALVLGLEIEITGFVSNPWALIKEGDLLVIPSHWEGDSLVAVEAIVKKQPILLSDIPDFRRFKLEDVCYATNRSEFAQRIKTHSDSLQNFSPSAETALKLQEERSLSRIADEWEQLLSSVLTNK